VSQSLPRRLDALEEIAERMRRREMRELILTLPEASDLTPAETEAAVDEAFRFLDELRSHRP
jgi:hypothetical protein